MSLFAENSCSDATCSGGGFFFFLCVSTGSSEASLGADRCSLSKQQVIKQVGRKSPWPEGSINEENKIMNA